MILVSAKKCCFPINPATVLVRSACTGCSSTRWQSFRAFDDIAFSHGMMFSLAVFHQYFKEPMRVGRLHHPKALDLPQRWRLQPRAGLYLRHRRQCRSPAGKRIHGQPLVGGALWPEIGSGGQCGYRSRPLRRAARDGGPGGERLCGYIIAISTGFPASVTRKILWKCPMSYKNTTASTDDCSTKHPAANHGSPPGALRYEKVKLLCPVVQQIQTEGKTQKEGELELKSERAVKDLLCRARYKQAKTIPKQQERKPARTFLQPRAYPLKTGEAPHKRRLS